jgi:hypothetical protein
MLTVRGQALGRKKPLFADWSIPLPPDLGGEGVTLRDVITAIVRAELTAFRERQARRQLFHALTAREIEAGVERGKVEMGGSEVPPHKVDEEAAIGTALQAFEDGLYLVVIDEQEQHSLDNQVFLQSDSRVTFVRLTLLAGG